MIKIRPGHNEDIEDCLIQIGNGILKMGEKTNINIPNTSPVTYSFPT